MINWVKGKPETRILHSSFFISLVICSKNNVKNEMTTTSHSRSFRRNEWKKFEQIFIIKLLCFTLKVLCTVQSLYSNQKCSKQTLHIQFIQIHTNKKNSKFLVFSYFLFSSLTIHFRYDPEIHFNRFKYYV